MKKKLSSKSKQIEAVLLACILGMTMLTGCGSSSRSESASTDMSAGTYAAYDTATEESASDSSSEIADTADSTSDTTDNYQQKLIKTYNYSFETTDMSASQQQVKDNVNKYGGYIESSSCYDSSSCNYTIRIPEDKADDFLSDADDIGEKTYESESQEDITTSYYDTAAHIEALETQHKRLLELMEKASSIDDIISLEERLSNVEYELSSYEQQLKIYDNQVDYVTIYIDITLVDTVSAQGSDSFTDKIAKGLNTTFSDLGNSLVNGLIWFIVHIPYIVVYGIIIAVIAIIIRKIKKFHANKKAMINQLQNIETDITADNENPKD